MQDILPPLAPLDEQPLSTNIYTDVPGLFVKHCVFDAGTFIPQHSHTTPHLSVIATGAVRVWKDGAVLGDFRAPAGVTIEAYAKHTFLALEPGTTVLCVHRDTPEMHEEHQFEGVG